MSKQIKALNELDWTVVPGGLGLSVSYLKLGLADMSFDYKMHFYNPLGAPEVEIDHVPKISELVEQIFKVAEEKQLSRFFEQLFESS